MPPSVKARWGSEWKKKRPSTGTTAWPPSALPASTSPTRRTYFDLDPRYKDHLGDPLLRMTIDWRENERKMVEFANAKAVELARAMGAKAIIPGSESSSATTRGAINPRTCRAARSWASRPKHSVVNTWGQHWELPNLFRSGRLHVPAKRRRQSHHQRAGVHLPHRRRHHRPLFETSRNAGLIRRYTAPARMTQNRFTCGRITSGERLF